MAISMDLPSSRLGTKEFWEEAYRDDVARLESNDDGDSDGGSCGEVWFGEGTARKVVAWIVARVGDERSARILDLGCGNGHSLLLLRARGFRDLAGVDYSDHAIRLARLVAAREEEEEGGGSEIRFHVADVVRDASPRETEVDFVLDKGTWDAISLDPDSRIAESRLRYARYVDAALKPSGCLLLSSCNWTREELLALLAEHFELEEELPAPTFSFGGKEGKRVTTLVLRKRTPHS